MPSPFFVENAFSCLKSCKADPTQKIRANIEANQTDLKTRKEILVKQGNDFEDVWMIWKNKLKHSRLDLPVTP